MYATKIIELGEHLVIEVTSERVNDYIWRLEITHKEAEAIIKNNVPEIEDIRDI